MATVTAAVIRQWLADKCGDNVTGTATAGAAGSLTDATRRREDANFWDGADLHIYGGTGPGQTRMVSTSTAAGVLNVAANWTVTPDATSTYELHRLHLTDAYDRFIAEAVTSLTRRRKLLQWAYDTTLSWVTDQFDYTVPTGMVAVMDVEIATVSGVPGSDDYDFVPREQWYVRADSTRKLIFSTAFGQQLNGYKLRVSGFSEFAIPANVDTDTYAFDPDPVIAWAYVFALMAEMQVDNSSSLQRLFENAMRYAELAEQRMGTVPIGEAKLIEHF